MKKYYLKKYNFNKDFYSGGGIDNEDTINYDKPIKEILYFHSDDCYYCDEFEEHWNKLNKNFSKDIKFKKLFGREHPELKSKYKVDGYPTIIFNSDNDWYEYKYKRSFENISKILDKTNK